MSRRRLISIVEFVFENVLEHPATLALLGAALLYGLGHTFANWARP